MIVKKFKRNVQLHKLGIAELEDNEKKVYVFLINNLTNLNSYVSDEYPYIIYFGKSRESTVLMYNSTSGYLWVSNDKVWFYFSNILSMKFFVIKLLIDWWVDITLNLKPKDIFNGRIYNYV